MKFTHLHVHSCFSFLEGLASPTQLAQAAALYGMEALALTDRNYLCGAVEFYDACLAQGVRPVLGLEVDVLAPDGFSGRTAAGGRLVLLAQEIEGWRSLCELSSLLLSDPQIAEPVLSLEELSAHTAGLLCLTGGQRGLAAKLLLGNSEREALRWLGKLAGLFSGHLYGEVQSHSQDDAQWVGRFLPLCKRQGIPLLATHTIDYLSPEQAGLQRVAAAVRSNAALSKLPPAASAPPEACFLSPSEMAARFAEIPEALSASQEVAERCRLELPLGRPHFPKLDLPAGQTPVEVLRLKAEQGAQQLYQSLTPEIRARLDHELGVVEERGYETLFLIVEDILSYARRRGVPLSSRGSAASSLVAHCLGITSPDPLKLNLYFERFLNPARVKPPDIDTDLCSRRRDDVIDYVYRRFGQDRVAMVCTVNRMRSRSALRVVAKAYGLSPSQVSALAERLPNRWYGPPDRSAARQSPYAELEEVYTRPPYPDIFRDAQALIGQPDHLSVHPGGIVISPGPLHNLAPTQMAAKGVRVTQFDLESIARLGLVKIDLLGIRGLTVIGDVAQAVQSGPGAGLEVGHPVSQDPLAVLDAIPEDDPATGELVRTGQTIGCFQIESPGMRATLKELQADSVDDLMAALALYRPGPLTGGLKDAFVHRHRGEEPTRHIHPALSPLLADTYGVILYQEQVLRIANELAGLSLADADLLRRAMSHFDPGQQMQTLKQKFVAGALAHSHVPENTAARIWEMMAAFAGYGFPKAHAASYAQVAWRAAWCKLHFPAIFMAAVLANWGGYYSQSIYLTEARRMGLRLRPPDVNHARREFCVHDVDGQPALVMGLDQVRDLTRRTQARICEGQPFRSIEDFLNRADPRPGEAQNLARCGALEAFGTIPAVLRRLEQGGWQGGQMALFSLESPRSGEDWPVNEIAAAQEEILGVSVIAHRLELAAGQIQAVGAMNTVEAAAHVGKRVSVAGMRQVWRRFARARGGYIYFMSLEDLEGMLEVVIHDDVYRRSRDEMEGTGPFVVEGLVEYDAGHSEPFIRAERIWKVPLKV